MINSVDGLLAALDRKPKAVRCEGWVTFQAENSGLIKRGHEKGVVVWSLTAEGEARKPKPPVDVEALKAKQAKAAKK